MRRWILLTMVLALLAAACGDSATTTRDTAGDGSAATTASPAEAGDSTAPAAVDSADDDAGRTGDGDVAAGTDDGDGDAATSDSVASAPQPDGPAAPDFELALADGGTFSLSAEQKPVYLIFWAEW